MSWNNYYGFKKTSVGELRSQAEKKIDSLKKSGEQLQPVPAGTGRGLIAKSFWGKAWCKNLESYKDFEYRLPRGRSYVRHGAVIDLKVQPNTVTALVNGSELYELTVTIDALPKEKWEAIKARCQGKIGSLIELLQGKISDEIMAIVMDPEDGLFPKPKEIHFNCNCPDWADMCKHVAASLYGVGVRLDESPELLFKLRGVDHKELIAIDTAVSDMTAGKSSRRRRSLNNDALGDVFGIELDNGDAPAEPASAEPASAPRRPTKKAAAKKKSVVKKAPVKKKVTSTKKSAIQQASVSQKPVTKKATKAKKKPAPFKPTAAKVRKLRKTLGLSLAAFAREVGVSGPTIKNWEMRTGALTLKPEAQEKLEQLYNQESTGSLKS